jgi:hypothetical protein
LVLGGKLVTVQVGTTMTETTTINGTFKVILRVSDEIQDSSASDLK